jgi:IS30 family transposase
MAGGRPGPAPLTEKRDQFAALIARGVSNAQACRIVGVNRRTGKRWRHGRTITSSSGERLHHPPVVTGRRREVCARYLSEDERVRIGDLHRTGRRVRAIATELGRPPSTISRELRRNAEPEGGQYRPFAAQRRAAERRARPGRGKLLADPQLQEYVQARLGQDWSPEQIAAALRREFPDRPDRHLVTETICQAIYRRDGSLNRDRTLLRTGRRRRRRHPCPDARRAGSLTRMTMLDQRPAEATDRAVAEGDLIVGANSRSAIGTVVERTTRFTLLLHLPAGRHTAEAVTESLIAAMADLPAALRRSLAWDQGKEMALHTHIAATLSMPVFFCPKSSPWLRGTNENTNRLLRQYFPKSTDLRVHGPEDLVAVAARLNARPRKTLGWDSPAQRLHRLSDAPDTR